VLQISVRFHDRKIPRLPVVYAKHIVTGAGTSVNHHGKYMHFYRQGMATIRSPSALSGLLALMSANSEMVMHI
jgi:hypothetical protein